MPPSWSVETLDATVDAEIAAFPDDLRARLARIGFLIEDMGLDRLREPYVRHLRGPLWEIRLQGKGPDRSGSLRDGDGEACGDRSSVYQENTKDAAAGDRVGVEAGK